jgi:hypothetical protein
MKNEIDKFPKSAAFRTWRIRRGVTHVASIFGARMLTDIGLRPDELGPPVQHLEWLRATHGRG